MADCHGREEPGSWTSKDKFSGGGGRVIGIEGSYLAFHVDGVPVDERAPLDVLD